MDGSYKMTYDLKFIAMSESIKKKNKCYSCSKKTGLLGFSCRCGNNFCSKHRYPEEHKCSIIQNTIKEQIENIKKMNPVVIAKKIEII